MTTTTSCLLRRQICSGWFPFLHKPDLTPFQEHCTPIAAFTLCASFSVSFQPMLQAQMLHLCSGFPSTFPGKYLWILTMPHHPPSSLLPRDLSQLHHCRSNWYPYCLWTFKINPVSSPWLVPIKSPPWNRQWLLSPLATSPLHAFLFSSFPPPLRILMLAEVSH